MVVVVMQGELWRVCGPTAQAHHLSEKEVAHAREAAHPSSRRRERPAQITFEIGMGGRRSLAPVISTAVATGTASRPRGSRGYKWKNHPSCSRISDQKYVSSSVPRLHHVETTYPWPRQLCLAGPWASCCAKSAKSGNVKGAVFFNTSAPISGPGSFA